MKISPVSATPSPVGGIDAQAQRVQNIRAVRMNTNATPGASEAPTPESLTIPDNAEAETAIEDTKPLSPQFAALAKQRRALQVKERELADREKALATASSQEGTVPLARLKSEPLSVLLESGVTYDQLTEAILANQAGDSAQVVEAKLKALEESFDKKLSDRDAQSEQQVLAEMRREATKLAGEGDDFEMIRGTNSVPKVMDLIERTYRKDGEVLDVREAMQLVEDELLAENLKIAGFKKVQSRLAPPAPVPPQQQRQMRTLTNRDTATPPMTAKQRALAAFHGTLKK